jgi:hypothetical protein
MGRWMIRRAMESQARTMSRLLPIVLWSIFRIYSCFSDPLPIIMRVAFDRTGCPCNPANIDMLAMAE